MRKIQTRRDAVIATQKRFQDKPFDWSKSATCIHLVRYHAWNMGHSVQIVPAFRSALGAKRALASTGFETLSDLLDSKFERITPAFMQVGDVLAMPGDDGWCGLVIKGDKTKFLGWHEDAPGCTIMEVDVNAALGAWRL